jgi:hypothetical protein
VVDEVDEGHGGERERDEREDDAEGARADHLLAVGAQGGQACAFMNGDFQVQMYALEKKEVERKKGRTLCSRIDHFVNNT